MALTLRFSSIKPFENADISGIKPDDILLTYNGQHIASGTELNEAIEKTAAQSEPVKVEILRNGTVGNVMVQPGPLGIVAVQTDVPDIASLREQTLQAQRTCLSDSEAIATVKVTTAPTLEGFRITETLDIVSAEYALGINVFGGLLTAVTDMVGGRSGTLQKAMRTARQSALNDLRIEASGLGGNAVIATRIEYSEYSGKGKAMLIIAAYGTAVKVEKIF